MSEDNYIPPRAIAILQIKNRPSHWYYDGKCVSFHNLDITML